MTLQGPFSYRFLWGGEFGVLFLKKLNVAEKREGLGFQE